MNLDTRDLLNIINSYKLTNINNSNQFNTQLIKSVEELNECKDTKNMIIHYINKVNKSFEIVDENLICIFKILQKCSIESTENKIKYEIELIKSAK